MLKVTKTKNGNILTLKLDGSIDETVDFNSVLGTDAEGQVRIDTKEVQRINSSGIKAWVVYFQKQAAQGKKLVFTECSPAIVEQLNLIKNFNCGGDVESIFVPFTCTKCKKQFVALFSTKTLKAPDFQVPTPKCTVCGADAFFDDVEEEYFAFVQRLQP